MRYRFLGAIALPTITLAAIPADYAGRPFADEVYQSGPPSLPGIVQCAFYDLGGEGVAYHDADAKNNGSGGLNREPRHQRAHASEYVWHFRENEGVDLSFAKDFADLNHPNVVAPAPGQLYIGWQADGEWVNYTVNVVQPGRYRIRVLYSHQPNTIMFDLNGKPAATCQLPRETGDWHTWDYAAMGTIELPEAGLQLLTLHYNAGNNFAFFSFELIEPSP